MKPEAKLSPPPTARGFPDREYAVRNTAIVPLLVAAWRSRGCSFEIGNFPHFKATATIFAAKTATVNDWAAIAWMDGRFYESRKYPDLEILDRVGGGDSFASGFIYGLMTTDDPQQAVDYGAAHGALAMTTPGDTSMADKSEVEKLMKGGNCAGAAVGGHPTVAP